MILEIQKDKKELIGEINLVSSKSECNRALIIQSLCKGDIGIQNISFSDDSMLLIELLGSDKKILDVKNAGTVMRFLTAFFAIKNKEKILTGSSRMKERPIKELVDTLIKLGAYIKYEGKEGFPPIHIKKAKPKIQGGEVSIKGNISSQYITALLLIAPLLEKGLILNIEGEITSKPYIDMTLKLMSEFGIKYQFENSKIIIDPQEYQENDFTVESDWSSASYWYALAALSDKVDLIIPFLKKDSLQGDSVVAKIMEDFGVRTEYLDNKIRLSKTNNKIEYFNYDFKKCPDLAQTFAFLCAALKIEAKLTGLATLRIKETDRIKALANEITKLGTKVIEGEDYLEIYSNENNLNLNNTFSSYEDHRMVLSASMLSMLGVVNISDYKCISKSYPNFLEDLKSVYFNIKEY
ncbi:MAG: 3-phosphoshikimate 1-carboxyvinyltransferase [Candidatus Sericytochromatia bacterium]